MSGEKRYGLILPGNKVQKKPSLRQVSSVFADDEEELKPEVKHDEKFGSYSKKNQIKRQVELEMEKALAEDPTVYEYDNIYEGIHSKNVDVKNKLVEKGVSKPKYIGNLLKAAEDRKKEMERRLERKIHKEREAEKGKFDDRDAFVTDSYRQKMEQMRKDEEMEKMKEEQEVKMDVTKQSDLTGFYRHLLKQAADENPEHFDGSSRNVVADVNRPLSKVETVGNPQSQERKSLQLLSICAEDCEVDVGHNKVVKASCNLEERCDMSTGHMEKAGRKCDSKKRSHDRQIESHARSSDTTTYKKDFPIVADKKIKLQCSEDRKIAPSLISPTSVDNIHQRSNSSETVKGGSECGVDAPDEVNVPRQHPNTVRRTTDSSLDNARVRFMARKSTLKVPVNVEDSD